MDSFTIKECDGVEPYKEVIVSLVKDNKEWIAATAVHKNKYGELFLAVVQNCKDKILNEMRYGQHTQ